jgi:hypothetical protein
VRLSFNIGKEMRFDVGEMNAISICILHTDITELGFDRLCGLVVRVPGHRSRFPALPDFLRSSGSGTGVH